jgi:RimJ/RimL family protein N-acetyltransferase
MDTHPTLETTRLKLRPFSEADIAELVPLIGTREVAATTLRIPHPYSEQDARAFLARCHGDDEVRLAITLRKNGSLCGGIGLRLALEHATEAARELLRYGFENLGLHRIFASHFKHNPASGRILVKLGMRYEGCQREHLRKWDQFVDSELYGILRREWEDRE